MKIVIIANNSNGLYLFRRQLISALVERGHEVIALTPFDTDVDNLQSLGATLVETPIDRRGTNPIRDYSLMKL
ncbi:MAG: glycosyltransferase family 4 protein, partial [Clostridiaceae bacterium]|nr:glycosyltransferase family 4 protein [Clostridiaceae bacterium]